MNNQADQYNTQPNQNTNMRPTNSQVGGPGALGFTPDPGSGQHQNDDQRRSEISSGAGQNQNQNTDQRGFEGANAQQLPTPTHPDPAGQNNQNDQLEYGGLQGQRQGQGQYYDQFAGQKQDQYGVGSQQPGQGQGTTIQTDTLYGQGPGAGQNDQYANTNQDQYDNQNQPHVLDRGGHRGPGGAVRAAEAGAAYEGGKLTHGTGGQHDGAQYRQGTGTGVGPGLGQHDQYQNHGMTSTGTGAGTGAGAGQQYGSPVRAAEAGEAYEGDKLAHGTGAQGQHGGHFTGHHDGVGTNTNTANAPEYGAGTGAGTGGVHPGAGAGAGLGTAAGATHPGHSVGQGVGQGTGIYAGQHPGGGTTTGPGISGAQPGTTTSAPGSGLSNTTGMGQAQVILGKLQQAGGALLADDAMKAKGLEREAKGVARVDQQEAQRLEGMAGARREKAGNIHAGAGPGAANAGVDPTVGTHGRNL